MKKILGAALLCVAMQVCYAQSPAPSCAHAAGINIEFSSFTANNWANALVFDLEFIMADTVELDDSCLVVTHPGFGFTINLSDTFDTLYNNCDTLTKPITIDFDSTALPYSYTKVTVTLAYRMHGHQALASTDIYLYFTPWRSIEVWNRSDFKALQRVWESSSSTATKPYISKTNLPSSDIPSGFEILEDWQENQYEASVPGLAYGISMLAIHPDSLTQDDSTASNKKVGLYRFNGNATGNIVAFFREDNAAIPNSWIDRPLCGLRVELWNTGGHIPIATGVSDINGDFDIPFDVKKRSLILTIYVKVFANNQEHDIRGYSRYPFRFGVERENSAKQFLGWNGANQSEDVDFGETRFDIGTFRGVSQSYLAYEFVEQESDYVLLNGLNIGVVDLPGENVRNTFFWPDELCPGVPNSEQIMQVNGVLLKRPSIFLERNEGENTVWHEFGHFVMWNVQDRCWTELVTSTGAHNSASAENPRLAFNEGFATGFMTMVDLHYHYIDQESQFDRNEDNERRREWNEINGYLSEYYIAMALRDLFDGASQITSCFNYDPSEDFVQPFFRDIPEPLEEDPTRFWQNHTDDYEYPLDLILDALALGSTVDPLGNGQVSSVGEYYNNLLSLVDCEDRRDIGIVFEENRIRWQEDIADIPQLLSTDIIGRNGPQETMDGTNENIENIVGGANRLLDALNLTTIAVNFNPQNLDVPELNTNTGDFNIGESTCLTDLLEITDDATLFVNNEDEPDRWAIDNLAGQGNSHIEVEVLEQLFVAADGTLHIGSDNQTATVTLADGFHVLNGNLIIEDNSELVVGSGAVFSVSSGHNIVLAGPNSVLRIEGHLTLNPQTAFGFTGQGRIIFAAGAANDVFFFQNSGINLQGNGNSHVVAEFHQNDFYALSTSNAYSTGSYFNIEDGKVLLGANTRLAVDIPITLNNVVFERLSTTGTRPRGLWLYGQKDVDIQHCDFYDFEYGICALSKYGPSGFKLKYCEFHDCENGLYSEGQGVELIGSRFEDCQTGWYGRGMGLSSKLDGCDLIDNYNGVVFQGETDLHFSKTNAHDNHFRGIGFYGNTLSGWCSDFQDNKVGLYINGDELILSPSYRKQTGRVNLAGNDRSIFFKGTWLRLNNGINDFDADDWNNSIHLGIAAQIRPKNGWGSTANITQLYAEKNVWDQTSLSNYPTEQTYGPLAEGNYTIEKYTPTSGKVKIQIDPPSQVETQVGLGINCPSYSGTGGGGQFPPPYEGDMHNTENGTPILDFTVLTGDNSHEFEGQLLEDVIETIVDDMYNETLTDPYTEATHRLHDVLMVVDNSGWIEGPDGYVSYLLEYAYLRMMEAFGTACMNEDGLGTGSTLAAEVLAVQQRALTLIEAETESTDAIYYGRFKYSMQLAETQWLVLDYTNAIAKLNSMLLWAIGPELDIINNAICRINYQNDVLTGTIDLMSVDPSAFPCNDHEMPEVDWSSSQQGITSVEGIDTEMEVYPNPADGQVLINIPNHSKEAVQVEIFDTRGRLVSAATLPSPKDGVPLAYSVSGLQEGLYLIQCTTQTHSYKGSLHIQH